MKRDVEKKAVLLFAEAVFGKRDNTAPVFATGLIKEGNKIEILYSQSFKG